jgi:hypothetical protein
LGIAMGDIIHHGVISLLHVIRLQLPGAPCSQQVAVAGSKAPVQRLPAVRRLPAQTSELAQRQAVLSLHHHALARRLHCHTPHTQWQQLWVHQVRTCIQPTAAHHRTCTASMWPPQSAVRKCCLLAAAIGGTALAPACAQGWGIPLLQLLADFTGSPPCCVAPPTPHTL